MGQTDETHDPAIDEPGEKALQAAREALPCTHCIEINGEHRPDRSCNRSNQEVIAHALEDFAEAQSNRADATFANYILMEGARDDALARIAELEEAMRDFDVLPAVNKTLTFDLATHEMVYEPDNSAMRLLMQRRVCAAAERVRDGMQAALGESKADES